MSKSMVRLALEGRWRRRRRSGPPVRFQRTHASTVQNDRSGSSAASGELARAKQPGGLGGAEVRIEHEAGPLAHEREVAGSSQLVTHRRGAAVLPHDGAVQRTPVRPVEGDERLPLVGDADGGDPCARSGEAASELGQGGPDRVPDLLRVVLDPARAGEVLGELPVGHVGDPALPVEGEGADAGGAGVDGDHGGHRRPTLIGAPRDIGVAGSAADRSPRKPSRTAFDLHGRCMHFVDTCVTTVV